MREFKITDGRVQSLDLIYRWESSEFGFIDERVQDYRWESSEFGFDLQMRGFKITDGRVQSSDLQMRELEGHRAIGRWESSARERITDERVQSSSLEM